MAYTKQNFVDGNTLHASELNHIENGITDIETQLSSDYVTKDTYNTKQGNQDRLITSLRSDIGDWNASYPDSTITGEVTALKNSAGGTRKYATIKELVLAEHPTFLPTNTSTLCATSGGTTTMHWYNPSGQCSLPADVTCTEASATITGTFKGFVSGYDSDEVSISGYIMSSTAPVSISLLYNVNQNLITTVCRAEMTNTSSNTIDWIIPVFFNIPSIS
nr:MAG TPA: hypothetical protein [Caudoviricetes sp.]